MPLGGNAWESVRTVSTERRLRSPETSLELGRRQRRHPGRWCGGLHESFLSNVCVATLVKGQQVSIWPGAARHSPVGRQRGRGWRRGVAWCHDSRMDARNARLRRSGQQGAADATASVGGAQSGRGRRAGASGSGARRSDPRRAAGRKRCAGPPGDVCRHHRLQRMGQRRRRSRRHLHWRGRYVDRQAHCAVQGVGVAVGGVSTVFGSDELDAAICRTDQFHGLGMHQRRCSRSEHRQREPHQHEAGEERRSAQGMHGRRLSPISAGGRSH